MKQAFEDIRAFHTVCNVPVMEFCCWPMPARIELRQNLIEEEFDELMDAINHRDMIEAADAIADCIVVLIGTALEFGIPLPEVWDEVHRSNMAKVDPLTGDVRYRDDGKVLKPAGWTPPDLKSILEGS